MFKESSMLIDYLTNTCPYLLWYLNTSQSMHPTSTTLMPNATIDYLLMNGSKIHNFNAKYHHIINDFFLFFLFFNQKMGNSCNLIKISTFEKNSTNSLQNWKNS